MIGWIDLDASRSDLCKALRGLVHSQAQGRYLTPTIPKKLVLVQPYYRLGVSNSSQSKN